MYKFINIRLNICEIRAFKMSKMRYFLLSQHFLFNFVGYFLSNGKSNCNKPIHIRKVLNGVFTIKQTALKNMQPEANDVISKMAEFALFWPKNAKISRMVHPIMTNYTIIFIPKS